MKRHKLNKSHLLRSTLALMLMQAASTQAGVTVSQFTGTYWTNTTVPPVLYTYNPPSGATTGEGNYGTASGSLAASLGESFSIPNVTNTYTLDSIQISMGGGASTNTILLFDLGNTNNAAPTNPQAYNSSTYTNVNMFSSGLTMVIGAASGQQTVLLQFTGADQVTLQGNHKYVFEIDPLAGTTGSTWYRGGGGPPNPNAAAYRQQGNINGGGNWREMAIAVSLVGVSNLVSTNAITTLNNPVPASYGPPTVWPYNCALATPTDANGTNVDESFGGATTVMGQTFHANRDFLIRNFYFAAQGTTNSGNYLVECVDLGTNSSVAAYGTSFNPSPTNNATNLFSSAVRYDSFSPVGLTNKTIVKFKLTGGDNFVITNGHYFFIGFAYAGGGNNDLILERTSTTSGTSGGNAFKGSLTSVSNGVFGASARDFIAAVEVVNPNIAFSVTNALLSSSWPSVASAGNGGVPVMDTFDDPSQEGGVLDQSTGTAVNEGFGPATGSPGLAHTMTFWATTNFTLGTIGYRQSGQGSSNCLFTLNIYEITNTYFSQTNTVEKWPRNYQPNVDTSPKGLPLSGTNLNFYYTQTENGTNGAGQGTNDQFLLLTINNPAFRPTLQKDHVYAIELTSETIGQNASQNGLFQLVRDIGQSSFEVDYVNANYGGINYPSPYDGSSHNILPRGLIRNFTDPETFAGGIASAESPRTFVMALYSATPPPTSINITGITRTGGSVTLNWSPSPAGSYSYSVQRRTNITSSTWTTLATGVTASTYTDTTASASTGFYRISSP